VSVRPAPERRPRVGYVLKRYPRISETFVASELIELERLGERLTVFAVSRPKEPFTHEFARDLRAEVVYLPHRPWHEPLRVARALRRVVPSNLGGWLSAARYCLWPPRRKGLRRLLQATVLRAEMERAGIDHAHAHFATAAARLANLAWRMGGPAYSVTVHAKDIYHREVRLDHLRDKLAPARFVATVSRANRDYLESVLQLNGRLRLVPNSVSLRRLGPARAGTAQAGPVLSVARLIEKKGLLDLIAAFSVLRARGLNTPLEIVGDGPMRGELEAVAARLGVDARFRGALPQEQVLELMERASVFCLPCVVAADGDRDGLPTSVLEAMALGVPVVTTDVNGLAEAVLHERTGLLVPQRDPVALAKAIERLLSDSKVAARLSAEGRRHVERNFSAERSAAILRSLFQEVA
jgi:colanic acid/amylovoran biosynthesis glycosyltransferase